MKILFMSVWAYIEYYDTKELQEKASQMDASVTVEANDTNKAIYEKYIKQIGHGWTLGEFTESGQFLRYS